MASTSLVTLDEAGTGMLVGPVSGEPQAAVVRAAPAASQPTPMEVVHRTLRGRYPLAVAGAMILGALGAFAGWRESKPLYQSDGLVQIKYAQPGVDPNTSQSGQTPFDVFMETQKTLVSSRRVIDRALQDPAWVKLGFPLTPQLYRQFVSRLEVKGQENTEYIKISYSDPDPVIAAAAVQSVTNAYSEVYRQDEQHLEATRVRLLGQKRDELSARIKWMQGEVDTLVKKWGSADLAPLHEAAVERTSRLDSAIEDVHLILASHGSSTVVTGTNPDRASLPSATKEIPPLSAEQIAATDSVMRGYLDTLHKLEDEQQNLELRGIGGMHPDMISVRHRVELAQQHVARYADECRAVQQATGHVLGESGIVPTLVNKTPAQLQAEEAKLIAIRADARHELVELEADHVEQMRRDADLRRDTEALDLTNKKIDQLADMDQMGGRLTVISAGETPLSPAVDRRIKFAGAGAMAGAMAPFGLIALFGIARRRYRYADETVADISPRAPLLGILPALNPRDPSEEQAGLAAQCVHRIRVLLQVGRPARQSVAYMISSATAAEGKTSLAMSLGLSFAAAGSRTLVIDGDLVGQQLTRGIEAGETPGLLEALKAGTLQGCLRRTMAGLYVLPVGNADVQEACAVSPAAFRRLLDQARSHFDSILIDSGPILGSVEASLVAQQVDGVILAVARGQEPSLVQGAMSQLKSLGAQVSGFVFNRALSVDFQASQYGSSRSRSAAPLAAGRGLTHGHCRLGPLVSAVASSLPSTFQTSMG